MAEEIKKNDKKGAEIGVEMGIGYIMPGSLWSDWTGNESGGVIINKPPVTLDQLVDMRRRDGQAKALIQLVSLPLRSALQGGVWVAPEEGGAEAETEFANQMWTLPPMAGGMTTPVSKLIRQIILSVTDGFAAFEIVRQVPKDGPLKNKITLQKLAYRDPRTIKFKVDKNGGYNGFRQTTHDGEGNLVDITLDPLKTVTFTHHDELNPYYGVSLFESAYPHFDAKRKLYYIAHLAAQFAAVPGRIGKIPAGAKPTEVVAFRQALIDFAFNAAMIVPAGYEVENFNGSSGFDFIKLIDHHNQQMSKSVLAPFFDADQRPVLIENGSQDASADIFLMAMESIAHDIAMTLTNHMMPQFIDFNFSTKVYPVFKPAKLSDSAKALIREVFQAVMIAGVLNTTPEMVRELEKKVAGQMGLDIDYDEIEKQEKIAAEEQQKIQEDQAAAQAEAAAQAASQEVAAAGGKPPVGLPGGVKPPNPGIPKKPPAKVGLSNSVSEIDDLVEMAQNLFLARPEDEATPVDESI